MDDSQIQMFEDILSRVLREQDDHTSADAVRRIVEDYGSRLHISDEMQQILMRRLEARHVTTMGAGVSLFDQATLHDTKWYEKREITWSYWEDYRLHLEEKKWPTRVLLTMHEVTDRILGLLADPEQDGNDWERRGLVIGHVQSGKTANYIGLMTKAADAGYKFIIVIAGIHNSLRTQTQQRVDEGFIGRDSATRQITIGVGKQRQNRQTPVTVTTTRSDFNQNIARQVQLELRALKNTFVLVVKKNASTLGNLYRWLKELNTDNRAAGKIGEIPMLMIDDEADNASVNTNNKDLDPTRINKEIRSILNLFRKRCYVGYTATPFANIFIDPDNYRDELGKDLFPEDFIYCLDAPSNYFGTERVFLDKESSNQFVREIDDAEDHLPLNHKKQFRVDSLPESLKRAIRLYILARAIRDLRGQEKKHSSMMINVSRFVNVQAEVRELVADHLEFLRKRIRYRSHLTKQYQQDEILSQFQNDFVDEFSSGEETWEMVLAQLSKAADSLKVMVINQKSDDSLDYKQYEMENEALNAIVIGGLTLSRGLTIEGLCVSYIYRNSRLYDTLLQMGRWFGYRDGYEDLCRVFMSSASRGWYEYISEATEGLRYQIKQMVRERKKPVDFGLYVRSHPDTLEITAANKMRDTGLELKVSYDGKLVETYILPASEEKNQANRELLVSTYNTLMQSREKVTDATNSVVFKDVPWQQIESMVSQYRNHNDMPEIHQTVPRFVSEIYDLYPKWDVVFRSLKSQNPSTNMPISTQRRTIGQASKDSLSETGWYTGEKNRFSDNNTFAIGLSEAQLAAARERAVDAERKQPIYSDFTNARGKPVLVFHLIDLVSSKDGPVIAAEIPAISVSFPNSPDFRSVAYVANPVAVRLADQRATEITEEDDLDFDNL